MGESEPPHILFIEPFYGGSHKVLMDTLIKTTNKYTLVTLPAKKWHWRARCSPLILYDKIPKITSEKILFCSSVLNLSELLGIRPDLHPLKKIVYFHENQLIYPVQQIKDRDVQYSYNEIMTCLAADVILFNSNFNKSSFINNIKKIVKLLPDNKPKFIQDNILRKSQVLYFPVTFPSKSISEKDNSVLHILWPHRWEFDKGPDDFFNTLLRLKLNNLKFRVSILGQKFSENPNIFSTVQQDLKNQIVHFGHADNKDEYYNILRSCHVVVSTAKHEFFGVAMLEGTFCGCFPLVPNTLVYPEIYPTNCLYSNLEELYSILKKFCCSPSSTITMREKLEINLNNFSADTLLPQYKEIFKIDCN